MKLLRELRYTGAGNTISDSVPIADLRVASATVQAVTASPINTLQIIANGALVAFQAISCRPYSFGGAGFYFGGPLGGESLVINTDNNDTYEVIIRLWDEPIAPYGRVPLLAWDEAAIAPLGTSAIFSAAGASGWVRQWSMLEIGDDARTVAIRQEMVGAVGALNTAITSAANVESQLQALIPAQARILRFQVTNTGAGALRTIGTVTGLLGT